MMVVMFGNEESIMYGYVSLSALGSAILVIHIKLTRLCAWDVLSLFGPVLLDTSGTWKIGGY